MPTTLDIFFIIIAISIMVVGTLHRWAAVRSCREEKRSGHMDLVIGYIAGHKRILRNVYAGIAHLFLFWGFVIIMILVILCQSGWSVSRRASNVISFCTETLGFGMVLACAYFLIVRLRSENKTIPTLLNMILLLAILCTGFLSEALRLKITESVPRWQYFIGSFISIGLPDSVILMQAMIRLHFFLVLIFIALIPFTLMRHALAAPVNVYYQDRRGTGSLKPVCLDYEPFGAETVKDFTWKQILDSYACVSCSRCDEVCPAFKSGKPLSPQKIVQNIFEQAEAVRRRKPNRKTFPLLKQSISEEEIWSCTTCMACVENCPVFIDPLDKIIQMRRHMVLDCGDFPRELQTIFENLEIYGDIYAQGLPKRKELASALHLPIATEGKKADWLLWIGCHATFHERSKDALIATVRLLQALDIKMFILGKEEVCCGDMARRTGNEYLYDELAQRNIEILKKYDVEKILTTCPHCMNTLRNDYPQKGAHLVVRHYSEVLWHRILSGNLKMKSSPQLTLTLQDPCYLSRIIRTSKISRKILESLRGVKYHQMKQTGIDTYCCGGGGGRISMHDHDGIKIADLRVKEACATGADVLITLCPYCLTMLEDGMRGISDLKAPDVKDLGEFLAHRMVS